MLGIIKLVASPYQSLAPIVSNPAPLALDLTKLGEALKEMWSWGSDQDVYDPEEAHRRVDESPIRWEPEVGSKPFWSDEDEERMTEEAAGARCAGGGAGVARADETDVVGVRTA